MIEPLFAGRSRHEVLSAMLEEAATGDYEIVRAFWQGQHPAPDFEQLWRKAPHDGVVANWSLPATAVGSTAIAPPAETPPSTGLHLIIRGDARTYDGRFANNAWLQEFPDPLTKIVWDNAALISARTAERMNLGNGDVVNLKFRGRSARAPIWVCPDRRTIA